MTTKGLQGLLLWLATDHSSNIRLSFSLRFYRTRQSGYVARGSLVASTTAPKEEDKAVLRRLRQRVLQRILQGDLATGSGSRWRTTVDNGDVEPFCILTYVKYFSTFLSPRASLVSTNLVTLRELRVAFANRPFSTLT